MEKRMFPHSSRKYLIIITDITILDIRIRVIMMPDIVLLEPPWPWESDPHICKNRGNHMTHFYTSEILIMDEVMRDIPHLDKKERKIEYRQNRTKNRHEIDPEGIEDTHENQDKGSKFPVRADESFLDEDFSEFLELFGELFFGIGFHGGMNY